MRIMRLPMPIKYEVWFGKKINYDLGKKLGMNRELNKGRSHPAKDQRKHTYSRPETVRKGHVVA